MCKILSSSAILCRQGHCHIGLIFALIEILWLCNLLECLEGLIGVSSAIKNALPNSAMTASTFHADHEPYWGRVLSSKWWMPSVHDKFQYLKIDLLSLTVVRKSAVQGSGDSSTAGARVITYFLYHSKDDTIWYPVLEKENPRV